MALLDVGRKYLTVIGCIFRQLTGRTRRRSGYCQVWTVATRPVWHMRTNIRQTSEGFPDA
jgi:hypothetical protein